MWRLFINTILSDSLKDKHTRKTTIQLLDKQKLEHDKAYNEYISNYFAWERDTGDVQDVKTPFLKR